MRSQDTVRRRKYENAVPSGGQAAKDAAKDVGVAGAAGGVGVVAAAVVAKGAAMAGIGLSLGPLGTPLAVAGGALLAGGAVYRIAKAARRDVPLIEYRAFFCNESSCKTMFARDVTSFAAAG